MEETMKCVKYHSGRIDRVSDDDAEALVKAKKAVYIPKQEYKKQQAAMARS
jgi:hypothetical protein